MMSPAGLVKQYEISMRERKKKAYENVGEGTKYLSQKERYEMLSKVFKTHLSNKSQDRITFRKVTSDPLIMASGHFLRNGERVFFRPLVKSDVGAFGEFLENLQEKTRARFGPHPLTADEARNICSGLNYSEMIPMILINMNQEIIGYMILSFLLRKSQLLRYQDYKIPIKQGCDACIAPVVADRYQNKGIGSMMLKETIKIAKSLGAKYLILWQGVQLSNLRAIHYYEKFGFKKNAEFKRYGTHNVDMTLNLRGEQIS
jgi:GNAT superfamily N-acetyltransferase